MEPTERFKIINNCLGYGNGNSKIIHFSLLEEYGDWSIPNLIKKNPNFIKRKQDICTIYESIILKIEDKISKINTIIEDNIIDLLDIEVEKLSKLKNHISECLPENSQVINYGCSSKKLKKYSTTVSFQFALSKYIIENYDSEYCLNDCKFETFGTILGNEVCINYNPVGKNSSKKTYEEYTIFFNLRNNSGFPNTELREDRERFVSNYINLKRKESQIKPFIFIYGKSHDSFFESNLKFEEFKMKERPKSWFKVDFENRIWWLYHPASWKNICPLITDIPDILNPRESNKVISR